jgi:hypothetical protein
MGNWFSSSANEKVTINNNNPPSQSLATSEITKEMTSSSLNLSLEEILKEAAIVILIIFVWETIKNKINKKTEKARAILARELTKSVSNLNTVTSNQSN